MTNLLAYGEAKVSDEGKPVDNPTAHMHLLTPAHFAAFRPEQFGGLTPMHIKALMSQQFAGFRPETFGMLAPPCFRPSAKCNVIALCKGAVRGRNCSARARMRIQTSSIAPRIRRARSKSGVPNV